MKRYGRIVKVGMIWLTTACVVGLTSSLWSAAASSRGPAAATPEMTPEVYLPFVSKLAAQVTPPPPGNWLQYVNYYRALAALPPVTENPSWSDGDQKHAKYCVKNDFIGHTEDPGNPWYTPEGELAAQDSNVIVSSSTATTNNDAIDGWMQGPFHAVGIIDARLQQVGFGSYREADGGWQMAAALDVLRGLGSVPSSVVFPVKWPSDGMTAPLDSYSGGEYPDPLKSCGYSVPSGLPIILQLGSGSITPNVTAHSLLQGSTPLEHCVFDETNYTNATDPSAQSLGRAVLDARDAIVLIPRQSLSAGSSYTVSITTNGRTYTWTFTVSVTTSSVEHAADTQIR